MHRIGLIGAGFIGEGHAEAIAAVQGLQLAASSRTTRQALDAFVSRYGGDGYTDYRRILDRRDIDAVCIALPHHLHAEAVELAAQAGKHILLEKPMAPTPEECDRILAAVARAGVKLMLAHTTRFIPACARAKEILAGGVLGEVVAARCAMVKQWEVPNRRPWHRERALGGGMWLTNGVHLVDRLMWLIDRPVRSVTAVIGTRAHQQQADDAATVFLRFDGGAAATVFAFGYRQGADDQETEVLATGGHLRFELTSGLFLGQGNRWTLAKGTDGPWKPPAMEGQWRAFREYLDGEIECPVSGAFARQVMQVVFAAEESSHAGREVVLTR
jgi:phthalate 4,5-cis-dihydrodiol dehydrogenase